MTSSLVWLLGLAYLSLLGGTASLCFQLALRAPVNRPTLGARGLNRARALEQSGAFALIDPPTRALAAWVASLPAERLRVSIRRLLVHSGDYLGLSEDELIAMSGLCGAGLALFAWPIAYWLDVSPALPLIALGLGMLAPWVRLLTVVRARATSISRALPGSVELAAMCMSAGLDFPGAIRRVVDSAVDSRDPLVEELARVLQEIDLGQTRRQALEGFAERVPIEQVRELVNSVVQAEDKGTPLARVLTIQSKTQRMRRSIEAEETASDAAIMLLGPMTLIFLCVIVLLLGPVVVRFMTGGLAPP